MCTSVLVYMCIILGVSYAGPPPNIVIIMADDLGWNDVSFHGSNQFMTPNIDALAYSGVILKDYYTQPICTPARAALLTGRHPIHNGMEHDVLYAAEPWGLPLKEKIMPEYLKPLGYATRAVGKWHLGFFKSVYTPSLRGFDTHYGNWLGEQNHFTHYGSVVRPGYDFRRELNISWDAMGKYAADLFTEEAETIIKNHETEKPLFLYVAHIAPHAPLQAPWEVVDQFRYIPEKKRQKFAAMVTKVDESVGRITKALQEKNMLNNSILLFLTDNGGATHGFNGNVASNFPLRGGKDTLWEGGVRGVGLVWSPLLQGAPRVHRGLVNVQDWLPTLLSAINSTQQLKNSLVDVQNLDGVSQWDALNDKSAPPYNKMLHNIDPLRNIAALRYNNWKLVTGRTYNGKFDGHYGQLSGEVPYNLTMIKNSASGQAVQSTTRPLPDMNSLLTLRTDTVISCQTQSETPHVIEVRQLKNLGSNTTQTSSNSIRQDDCEPQVSPCLFDVLKDPCELVNVATLYPAVVKDMLSMIKDFQLVPPNNKPGDPRSYPVNWNNTWVPWQDFV